jgi:hypothetical protein
LLAAVYPPAWAPSLPAAAPAITAPTADPAFTKPLLVRFFMYFLLDLL